MDHYNPTILDVSGLDQKQRVALAESVVGAYPVLTADEDCLPDEDHWTLRKAYDASDEDWDEEIEFILMVYGEAEKGELVPTESRLPSHHPWEC